MQLMWTLSIIIRSTDIIAKQCTMQICFSLDAVHNGQCYSHSTQCVNKFNLPCPQNKCIVGDVSGRGRTQLKGIKYELICNASPSVSMCNGITQVHLDKVYTLSSAVQWHGKMRRHSIEWVACESSCARNYRKPLAVATNYKPAGGPKLSPSKTWPYTLLKMQ